MNRRPTSNPGTGPHLLPYRVPVAVLAIALSVTSAPRVTAEIVFVGGAAIEFGDAEPGPPPNPTHDGFGNLAVVDIGDPQPSPDVVDTPAGMKYTNRRIEYTAGPYDVFPTNRRVTVTFQMRRPFELVNDPAALPRVVGSADGSVYWDINSAAAIDDFTMEFTGFYADLAMTPFPGTTARAAVSQQGEGWGFRDFGDGSFDLRSDSFAPVDDGQSEVLPVNTQGYLVSTVSFSFTPVSTGGGDYIALEFPDSFIIEGGVPVPEPSALVLLATTAGAVLAWGWRRRK